MHSIRSLDGEPRKKFEKRNGVITSSFHPGSRFDLERSLSRENFSFYKAAELLRFSSTDNRAIVRSLPRDGSTKNFSLQKRVLENCPLWYLLADVDSGGPGLLLPEVRDCVRAFMTKAGIPEDTGWFAKWSSSRFLVDGEPKASIHIGFLLSEDITEAQAKQIFLSWGSDPTLSERGRLLSTLPPTFAEADLVSTFHRYQEIDFQEGKPLDPSLFLDSPVAPSEPNQANEQIYRQIDNLETQKIYDELKKSFEPSEKTRKSSEKKVNWKDIKGLCKAASNLLKQGKLKHRHQIHYWLLKLNFHLERDCYTAISEILNDPILLGNHTHAELIQQQKKIERDFAEESSAEDISLAFDPDEIIRVDLESFADLEEEDFERLNIPRGTIVVKSGEGTGKTYFLIKKIIDRFDPETIASICHRLTCLNAQAEQWSMTYQYDIGKDDPMFSSLSGLERKRRFIPDCPTPAITWHALDFVMKEGEVNQYEIVVIDELEHVLEEFVLSDDKQGVVNQYDQLQERFYRLIEICDRADLVIVADAMLSDGLSGYFFDQLKRFRKMERRLLLNEFDYVQRMDFFEMGSLEESLITASHLMKEGKRIAVCSDYGFDPEKPTVEDLAKIITRIGDFDSHQVRFFDAREKKKPRPNMAYDQHEMVRQGFDDGVLCDLFSPAFDTGWQIAIDDDRYIYDAVFVISSHGLTHAAKLKEFFRRFRFTKQAFIYIKKKRGRVRPAQMERSHAA